MYGQCGTVYLAAFTHPWPLHTMKVDSNVAQGFAMLGLVLASMLQPIGLVLHFYCANATTRRSYDTAWCANL